jgi:hypothetical protein
MRNVTITLEEEVARWARIRAAGENKSVSRLVGEMLKEFMQKEQTYEDAMTDYFSRGAQSVTKNGKYPAREKLYDRKVLR